MPITFTCESCRTSLTVPSAFAGRTGRCPKCGNKIIAPANQKDQLRWMPAAVYDYESVQGTAAAKTAIKVTESNRENTPRPSERLTAQVQRRSATTSTESQRQRKPTESWGQTPAPLPMAQTEPTPVIPVGPRLTVISDGPVQGVVYSLSHNQCSVIGRDPRNDVAIPSGAISRHHCQIEKHGDLYTITDLGSANGTLVNSENTVSTQLKDGDYIQVGDTLLQFKL